MKKTVISLLVALVGILNAGTASALSPKPFYLNQSFILQKGETAFFQDYPLTINLQDIVTICVDPGPIPEPGVRYGCYPHHVSLSVTSNGLRQSVNITNEESFNFGNFSISLTNLIENSGTFLVTGQSPHPAGTNVKTAEGTVWFIDNALQRRPYNSPGAFLSYGFNNWASVVDANSSDLALPIGSLIPPSDGRILCSDRGSDRGTCYLMTEGKKAGFTSEAVFRGLGFSFSQALRGDISFITPASNISNTQEAHRPGALVNNNGRIDLITVNGLAGIPSLQVFHSWGFSFENVMPANNADKSLVLRHVVSERQAGQLFPDVSTIIFPLTDGDVVVQGTYGGTFFNNQLPDAGTTLYLNTQSYGQLQVIFGEYTAEACKASQIYSPIHIGENIEVAGANINGRIYICGSSSHYLRKL